MIQLGLLVAGYILATNSAIDYQRVLYPNGLPTLPTIEAIDSQATAQFTLLGHVATDDGVDYVLFSLSLPEDPATSGDDTHDIYLAAIAPDRAVQTWFLNDDLPTVLEPGSSFLYRLSGCISLAAQVQVLHISLWSTITGTGHFSGVTEVFWTLPLGPNGTDGGVHLVGIGQHNFDNFTSYNHYPSVRLARLRSGEVAVVVGDEKLLATPLHSPQGKVAIGHDDILQEFPLCRVDLGGRLRLVCPPPGCPPTRPASQP